MEDPMENLEKLNEEAVTEPITQEDSTEAKPVSKSHYTQFILPGAILLAALIVSGTLLYSRGGSGGTAQIGGSRTKPEKIEVKIGPNDHVLGNQKANVTIVEFSDFQCPFCRSFWSSTLPEIKRDYIDTGKAKFVYKHYPLDFHPGARPAAEASECANDQGRFWEFHDKVFEEQAKQGQGTIQFGKPEVVKWATAVGLNMFQFNECFNSGKYTQRVSDDLAYGAQLNVGGTPTTFINGQKLVGAQAYANFKTIIDSFLK